MFDSIFPEKSKFKILNILKTFLSKSQIFSIFFGGQINQYKKDNIINMVESGLKLLEQLKFIKSDDI